MLRRGRTLGGPLVRTPATRGEKWICPTGAMIAPHAGAGTPFFGRRQRKGEETAYHALDEGTE